MIDCFGKVRNDTSYKEFFLFVKLNANGQMELLKTYTDSLSTQESEDAFAGTWKSGVIEK